MMKILGKHIKISKIQKFMEIGLIKINIKIILFILLIYFAYKFTNVLYFKLALLMFSF